MRIANLFVPVLMLVVAVVVGCCAKADAVDYAVRYGIQLAPGETLLSVDGVPVQGHPTFATPVRSTLQAIQPVRSSIDAVGGFARVTVSGVYNTVGRCYVDANGNRVCPNRLFAPVE